MLQNPLEVNSVLLQPPEQHLFRREREQLAHMGAELSAGSINGVSLWAPEREQTDQQCSFVPTLASHKVAKWKWKPTTRPLTDGQQREDTATIIIPLGNNAQDWDRGVRYQLIREKVEVPPDRLCHCREFPWQVMVCTLLWMQTNRQRTALQWKAMPLRLSLPYAFLSAAAFLTWRIGGKGAFLTHRPLSILRLEKEERKAWVTYFFTNIYRMFISMSCSVVFETPLTSAAANTDWLALCSQVQLIHICSVVFQPKTTRQPVSSRDERTSEAPDEDLGIRFATLFWRSWAADASRLLRVCAIPPPLLQTCRLTVQTGGRHVCAQTRFPPAVRGGLRKEALLQPWVALVGQTGKGIMGLRVVSAAKRHWLAIFCFLPCV